MDTHLIWRGDKSFETTRSIPNISAMYGDIRLRVSVLDSHGPNASIYCIYDPGVLIGGEQKNREPS